mgnify:CR=1 FL=1
MANNKEKRPLTKEESRMLFDYFHNKSSEDIAEAEYQEFMESDFLEKEVAERIEEKIREDVEMSHLDGFCNDHNERMKELGSYRNDHNEIDKWDPDHGAYYSLNNFAALSWSDWRDDLDVLDVDDCLSQHRDAKRPGEKIDEAIVKPLFLKEYGIKLS